MVKVDGDKKLENVVWLHIYMLDLEEVSGALLRRGRAMSELGVRNDQSLCSTVFGSFVESYSEVSISAIPVQEKAKPNRQEFTKHALW